MRNINQKRAATDNTFDSARNVEKSPLVASGEISGVEVFRLRAPERFQCLLLHVEITHAHVAAVDKHLKHEQTTNDDQHYASWVV